jgi:predicted TIM-barrel fold metal-dependent hydrolase
MDFKFFDADNHYYEAEDAFLRHADAKVKKHVRWLVDGKRRYLAFGNNIPADIPNATFNPVSKPGSMHERLKALEAGAAAPQVATSMGESVMARGGDLSGLSRGLVPISPEYRDREMRLARMDEQGVEKAFMFPTLGQSVETMVTDEPDMMYRVFRAFNDWVADDWGYHYGDRIYAPPVVPMMEINGAVAELKRVIEMGAKAVCLRSGPVYGRSPADPYFDPFWSIINETGTLVGFHALAAPTPYHGGFKAMWNRPADDTAHMKTVELTIFPFERPAMDSLTAMILGNMFGRFPNLKVAVIEMGASWVEYLMHSLDHAGGITERRVTAFGQALADKPSEILKEHVWVSPFPEEDVVRLTRVIGVDHVLMGSDWPHAEGNVQPADYEECLEGLDDNAKRRIMRENALELVG